MKSIPKVAEDRQKAKLSMVWHRKKVYITNRNCGCDMIRGRQEEVRRIKGGKGITVGSGTSIHGSLDSDMDDNIDNKI